MERRSQKACLSELKNHRYPALPCVQGNMEPNGRVTVAWQGLCSALPSWAERDLSRSTGLWYTVPCQTPNGLVLPLAIFLCLKETVCSIPLCLSWANVYLSKSGSASLGTAFRQVSYSGLLIWLMYSGSVHNSGIVLRNLSVAFSLSDIKRYFTSP